ncbi:MAG: hypothetical protein KGI81_05915 [Betaproteobacteria bacterium]|nr:hypothetical protein [Betaproteobacteria bacterium]
MSSPCWHWERALAEFDYRLFYPLCARLPFAMGGALAAWKGRRDARHDRDWRSLSLRRPYVKDATRTALATLCPQAGPDELERLVTERFVAAASEEWQAHLILAGRAPEVTMTWEGMTPQEVKAAGPVLWMTVHYDSFMLGVVHFGLAGLPFNLMTSTVVEDARIPASIRRYYARKYAAVGQYFNGGQSLQAETRLKSLYAGPRAGMATVMLVDAPALQKEEGVLLEFLGRRRYMAPGAVRMAEYGQLPMGAFVCVQEAPGRYRLVVHPPLHVNPAGFNEISQTLYTFLGEQIMKRPGRWWAADLLPTMKCEDA